MTPEEAAALLKLIEKMIWQQAEYSACLVMSLARIVALEERVAGLEKGDGVLQ